MHTKNCNVYRLNQPDSMNHAFTRNYTLQLILPYRNVYAVFKEKNSQKAHGYYGKHWISMSKYAENKLRLWQDAIECKPQGALQRTLYLQFVRLG